MRPLLAAGLWLALARPCDVLAVNPRAAVGGWAGRSHRCRAMAPRLQLGECLGELPEQEPGLDLAEPADPLGSLPPVGNLLEPLKPHLISVVEQDPRRMSLPPTQYAGDKFVELFRSCAPYIKMHQGRTVVLHISSAILDLPNLFDEAMEVRSAWVQRVARARLRWRVPPTPLLTSALVYIRTSPSSPCWACAW